MLGTFGGALEARKIDAGDGRLTADVRGEVESGEDGVLVIRRIHVAFTLKASENAAETVDRVHGFFAEKCPVFRSLRPAIQITSSYRIVSEQ